MTCKDCLYEPNCIMHNMYGVGKDWNGRYTPDVEKRCLEFESKKEGAEGDT